MTKAVKETRPVAMNRIEHGVAGKDGKTEKSFVFEAGDVVEGLDRDTMKKLIEGGAVKVGE
jgi:hypothetical protein